MTRYSTVLFDLDHTLLDSHASEQAAFDTTMRSIGVDPTPDTFGIYDGLNQALWRRVEAGEMSPNDVKVERFAQLLAALEASGDPVEMGAVFVQGLTDNGELYAGARELLSTLDESVRLGMITNGIGSVQRGRIDRLGLDGYFDVVSISGELGKSKPGAEIFDLTLLEMNISDRSGVVMVGDSLASDIAGANNAEVASIWFNPGGSHGAGVRFTHEVSELGDILAVLG
jgi:YjjG family noncanonical pyrimidine nucleotidase